MGGEKAALDGLLALVAHGGEDAVLLRSCHENVCGGLSVILVGKAGATAMVEEMMESAESI